MQRYLDRYREKLAAAVREYKKVAEDNERLQHEIRQLRSEQRPVPKPGESPEDIAQLRSRNQTLEKELGQLRFNAKLKIKQLQKDLQAARGASTHPEAAELSLSLAQTDNTETRDRELFAELQDKLAAATETAKVTSAEVQNLQNIIESMEQRHAEEIEALRKNHAVEMEYARLPIAPTMTEPGHSIQTQEVQPRSLDLNLVSRISDLGSRFQYYDPSQMQDIDISDPNSVLDVLSAYFVSLPPKDTDAAQEQIALLQSTNHTLRKRLSKTPDTTAVAPWSNERIELLDRISTLEETVRLSQITADTSESEAVRNLMSELASERSKVKQLMDDVERLERQRYTSSSDAINDSSASSTQESTVLTATQTEMIVRDLEQSRLECKTIADERNELARQIKELQAQVAALEAANAGHLAITTSSDISAIEQRNFTLEEQIKDFRIQIAHRQRELALTQEQLETKTSECDRITKEHEDRIRKMKGLLLAANKNITETKKLIALRETEVEELKARLEANIVSEVELRSKNDHLQKTVEQMGCEIQDSKDSHHIIVDDLQKQLLIAQAEVSDLRAEFQSYKVRAAAALQKTSSVNTERRIAELEETRQRLEREASEKDDLIVQAQARSKLLEADLNLALEQISVAEKGLKRYERTENDLQALRLEMDSLKRTLEFEKQMHEEGLKSKTVARNKTV
eukprot:jgi/Hompol1/5145/HPOL_000850-RA